MAFTSHFNSMPDSHIDAASQVGGMATETSPTSPDRGPWMVNVWPSEKVVLQSDDFKHDVALIVDGDFGSREDKLAYANALAAWMNANLHAAATSAAGN
ncbi:hypothetical protein [Burkholderia ubonensis]|uniref:hypothetical protein n=2 Tax=Burkholderia ubonensis TaxID=101571 RepID=UPI000ADC0E44|nr:hypothetical protein [Burkholderia ubonensis]